MKIEDIDNLADLAKELKNDRNKNVYKIFDDYALKFNLDAEELEQVLAKEYDCFKCDSCERFYTYDEYSFFTHNQIPVLLLQACCHHRNPESRWPYNLPFPVSPSMEYPSVCDPPAWYKKRFHPARFPFQWSG